MKVIVCCPECGHDDLEFLDPSISEYFKCTRCEEKFHIQSSGYNVEKEK